MPPRHRCVRWRGGGRFSVAFSFRADSRRAPGTGDYYRLPADFRHARWLQLRTLPADYTLLPFNGRGCVIFRTALTWLRARDGTAAILLCGAAVGVAINALAQQKDIGMCLLAGSDEPASDGVVCRACAPRLSGDARARTFVCRDGISSPAALLYICTAHPQKKFRFFCDNLQHILLAVQWEATLLRISGRTGRRV